MTPHEAMAAWAAACTEYDDASFPYIAARAAYEAAATEPSTPDRDALRRAWAATVPARDVARNAVFDAHARACLAYSATHGPDVADLFLRLTPRELGGPGQVEATIAALLAPPTRPAQ